MPDARLLRRSLPAFAEEVGRPLAPWQAAALELERRVTVLVSPRQVGKSRSLATLAAWWAFGRPGQTVLIVSAGEDAARRLLAEVRRVVTGSPLLASSVVDESAGLVALSNGSEVRSVPASERQVRGWSVDLLLVDECALVSDDLLLSAAFPTTAARPDARIVLASSPLTTAGAFFDLARRGEEGDEHTRTFRWALRDAWWIAPSVIEAARASMSPLRFRAEFEGEFVGESDALFPRSVLERVLADFEPLSLGALGGRAGFFAGCDWGWTSDRSAVVAVGRLAGERRFAVALAHAWPEGTAGEDVIADLAGAPAQWARVTSETNGLGAPLTAGLFRALRERETREGAPMRRRRGAAVFDALTMDEDVARLRARRRALAASTLRRRAELRELFSSSASKAAGYSTARLLVDRGELVIPRAATALVRELLTLRVDLTPSGLERIEASSGSHDDLTDALVAALSPTKDRLGRWTTAAGEYAAEFARLPAPDVDAGILRRLERDGIDVPLTPVWQGLRGSAVTMPDRPRLVAQTASSPATAGMRAAVAGALTTTRRGVTSHDV